MNVLSANDTVFLLLFDCAWRFDTEANVWRVVRALSETALRLTLVFFTPTPDMLPRKGVRIAIIIGISIPMNNANMPNTSPSASEAGSTEKIIDLLACTSFEINMAAYDTMKPITAPSGSPMTRRYMPSQTSMPPIWPLVAPTAFNSAIFLVLRFICVRKIWNTAQAVVMNMMPTTVIVSVACVSATSSGYARLFMRRCVLVLS